MIRVFPVYWRALRLKSFCFHLKSKDIDGKERPKDKPIATPPQKCAIETNQYGVISHQVPNCGPSTATLFPCTLEFFQK
jgi:hypothetical protein